MKNLFIITEEEKSRILGLHKNATKRQYLNEQKVDRSEYNSNKANYAPCVQSLGVPVKVDSDYSNYAIKGKGVTNGFMFYPYPEADNKPTTTSIFYAQKPNTKDVGGRVQCSCNGKNAVVIDGKSYSTVTRIVPTTEDQLAKGQGYLKLNDKNNLVSIVQDMLIFLGEKITKTGVYDKATYDAVKKFQTENKSITNQSLNPDGILGKNTYLTLKRKYDSLKNIEFKGKPITDTDTGDDVVVPDNNSGTNATPTQQQFVQSLSSAKQPQ